MLISTIPGWNEHVAECTLSDKVIVFLAAENDGGVAYARQISD